MYEPPRRLPPGAICSARRWQRVALVSHNAQRRSRAITYTSIPNACHQVRGLLTSQKNCHLEVLIIVLHAEVYVSIKLSPTKLKIHLCRTGPALGFTLGKVDTKLSRGRTRARTKNTQHVSTCCSPTSKSSCPLLLRDRPCASPDLQDDFCILCRAVHSASSPPNRSAKSPQTTPAERIDEIETLLEDESRRRRRRRRRCSTYHPAEFRILLCLARTDQIPLSRLQLHASSLTLDGAIGEQSDHLLSRRFVRAVCADVELHRREI